MRKMMNPVLVSGIKRRMRGVRTPILMSVYFLLLLGAFALAYNASAGINSYSYYYYSGYVPRPGVEGMDLLLPLYSLLVIGILVLVLLLTPALNASNISSEREKQTLDLLLSSRLSAIKIVMGKILANLAFVAFLLMLALPFFAVLYLFGSILPLDIILVYLFLLVTAYACASIGTFFSALMKKTSAATVLTYVALIVFCVITFVAGFFIMANRAYQQTSAYTGEIIPMIMRINPLYALVELIMYASESGASTSAILMFGQSSMLGHKVPSVVWSALFMLAFSPLLNVAAALLIKPVQKFQLGAGGGARQAAAAWPAAQMMQPDQKYPVYPVSPAMQQPAGAPAPQAAGMTQDMPPEADAPPAPPAAEMAQGSTPEADTPPAQPVTEMAQNSTPEADTPPVPPAREGEDDDEGKADEAD